MLAGISVDYLVRLEQGRGPLPSTQVLGSLARALQLDHAERDALFHLAGTAPPAPGAIPMHVRPSVLRLLDRLGDLPAIVVSAKGDALAWNAMSSALLGDWSAVRLERRNLNRIRFLPDPTDPLRSEFGRSDAERRDMARNAVAGLRSAAARYPEDPGLTTLLADLRAGSPEFVELWETGEVGGWRNQTKTVRHPTVGAITLDCDTLHVPDDDQTVIVYSAAPGTPAADALALLRVVGTQDLEPTTAPNDRQEISK